MKQKNLKFIFLAAAGALSFTSCSETGINRVQALQTLNIIQSKQVSDEPTKFDFNYTHSWVDSKIQKTETYRYLVSVDLKAIHASYLKISGDHDEIITQNEEYYFIKNQNFYSLKTIYDKSSGEVETQRIQGGTSNSDLVLGEFYQNYGNCVSKVNNTINDYASIEKLVALISSYEKVDQPKTVKDKYYSKGNGYLRGNMSIYTSTSRKNISSTTKFLYDHYSLSSYSCDDFRNDDYVSITISNQVQQIDLPSTWNLDIDDQPVNDN